MNPVRSLARAKGASPKDLGGATSNGMNLEKTLSRRILLIAIITGFVFSLALSLDFILHSSTALIIENVVVLPKQEQPSYGLPAWPVGRPMRLRIPGINVDSAVEYVGLTSDGAMDVPKSQDDVAWFETGQRPGENGSAVIDGHYGRKDGKGSVFDDLYKLRKGDKLYIEDDKGVTTTFVVRESRRYNPNADALGVFSSNDGKSHLNLITCEGTWDKSAQQYSERLVVFTDKETE